MTKRTITDFFAPATTKRIKPTSQHPVASISETVAGAATKSNSLSNPTATSTASPSTAGAVPIATSTVTVAGGNPTATVVATAVPPADPAAQAETLRLHGLHNLELAKAVVAKAADDGEAVSLQELLVEPTWQAVLQAEFKKPYFASLQRFVAQERQAAEGGPIYPALDNTFRAFNSCPFDQVRVVILGQDPYPGEGQAMGLCFSVPPGVPVPSSLRNIFSELQKDVGAKPPGHGDLTKWTLQGVLLLNAVMTVRAQKPASHKKKGWETLTDAAISALSAKRKGLVFMLWGSYAQDKAKLIDTTKHHILKAAHPSGLSASRGFFGCKHFSQANELLAKSGLQPIDWQLDPVIR